MTMFLIPLLIYYLRIVNCAAPPLSSNVSVVDMVALQTLYETTKGWNWIWRNVGTKWNFTTTHSGKFMYDPCADEWQGICCHSTPVTNISVHCSYYLQNVSSVAQYFPYPLNFTDLKENVIVGISLPYFNLDGYLPPILFGISSLLYLILGENRIGESIPAEIGNLQKLQYLNMERNRLNGTIPTTIGKLTQVYIINLYTNHLTGPIPTSIGKMQSMKELYLYDNKLNGTLPTELAMLDNLQDLYVYTNKFYGSIPSVLATLSNLVSFQANLNSLSGKLPPELGLMKNLRTLELSSNHFQGTIPSTIVNMFNLTDLELEKNYFTGKIPSNIGSMTWLTFLSLFHNLLTGSLPSSMSSMSALTALYLDNNLLTGTISSSIIASFTNLEVLQLQFNFFTGELPDTVGVLTQLNDFGINNNQLTGPLLNQFSLLTNLTGLFVEANCFTGSIPSGLGLLTRLQDGLIMNNNYFTGTVPATLAYLQDLEALELQVNHFTGSLPSALAQLTALNTISLHSNSFSGNPSACFDPGTQRSLKTVDLSDNSFSGSVPVSIFLLPNISTIAMIRNCFSGSLSDELCSNDKKPLSLETIALDGLTAGANCQQTALNLGSYTVHRFLDGSIPSCMFAMPSVRVLQLSGNGLSGPLPSIVSFHSRFRNLSLSHNRLSGTIPNQMQEHDFDLLDLSYNKLSGTVDRMNSFFVVRSVDVGNDSTALDSYYYDYSNEVLESQKQLILQVNRLSGTLPTSFVHAENIEIVTGNLFTCTLDSPLPLNDPGTDQAQCGSRNLNVSLALWLVVFVATVLWMTVIVSFGRIRLSCCLWGFVTAIREKIVFCLEMIAIDLDNSAPGLQDTISLYRFLEDVWRCGIVLTTVIVLFFLPFDVLLKYVAESRYSTHTYQYAFVPSMAFVSSTVPATLYLVFLIGFMGFVSREVGCSEQRLALKRHIRHAVDADMANNATPGFSRHVAPRYSLAAWGNYWVNTYLWYKRKLGCDTRGLQDWAVVSLVAIADAAVILVANGCYIYTVLYTQWSYSVMCSFALVAFKIVWNSWFLPYMIDALSAVIRGRNAPRTFPGGVMTLLMLFNNILAPLVCILCSDPSCFYNIFIQAADVNVSYYFENICTTLFSFARDTCVNSTTQVQLSFLPPFIYGFQCSSSLLVYYAPVFTILYIYTGFVAPMVIFAATIGYAKLPWGNGWILWMFGRIGPRLARSKQYLQDVSGMAGTDSFNGGDVDELTVQSERNAIGVTEARAAQPLMNADVIGTVLICHLATLLTFGTAYPLLAVLICASICTNVLQWRVLLGRYLRYCDGVTNADKRSLMLQRLNDSCRMSSCLLYDSRWILLNVMSWFFAMFLVDMAGDKSDGNWRLIVWAPVTLIIWPWALQFTTYRVKKYNLSRGKVKQANPKRSSSIFLRAHYIHDDDSCDSSSAHGQGQGVGGTGDNKHREQHRQNDSIVNYRQPTLVTRPVSMPAHSQATCNPIASHSIALAFTPSNTSTDDSHLRSKRNSLGSVDLKHDLIDNELIMTHNDI